MADPQPLPTQELLTAFGIDPQDPKVQLLSRLLERRRKDEAPDEDRSDADDAHARTRRKLRRLKAAYTALAERNAALAAACGACICWGDERCPICRGRGGPGWRAPDEDEFLAYVAPALRRLGLVRDAEVPSSTQQTRSETNQKE